MRVSAVVVLAVCALCSAAGAPAAVRQQAGEARPAPAQTVTERYAQRLGVLTPDVPEAYFNLAEEVLDGERTPEGRALAVRLFVLSYVIDTSRSGAQTLAASACLALAEASDNRSEREWLRALALQIDPRRELPVWVQRKPPATSEAIDYQVAVAVGLTRTGDGAFARQLLRRPEVRDRLFELDRIARRMGISGGADGIVREASRWPCPTCGNLRYEKRSSSLLGEAKLCSTCKGRPGAKLSRADYVAQLRFESWLLAGAKRTWASQVTVDMGEPLPDLDPSALPRLLSVDPTRPWFRGGRWVQTAGGDVPPAEPKEPAPGEAGRAVQPPQPPAPTSNGG
ncbi:MAG: hypothetical protein U0637_15185 [Phycisphaerales bacterium]